MSDTIFAQATARGRSGVAVIRISGPRAPAVIDAFGAAPVPARRAALRMLHDPATGEAIDSALVLRFAAPASFTGEDVVELQLHGSLAVVRAVGDSLTRMPGLRPAEPGEFTRRALMNGRLDLAQVEGLGDLIEAETEAQRRAALRMMRGAVGRLACEWREGLVAALALVEASIDFGDEDIPEDLRPQVLPRIAAVRASMARELAGGAMAERLREGFEVALVGAPNAGKSTLLNALAGRDVAITSEVAGTTRDVIEVRMDLRGLPVTLLDTAGLRATGDAVERIGVERARDRAAAADLRVVLAEDAGDVAALGLDLGSDDIVVRAKADLVPGAGGLAVSGLTGVGIGELLDRIAGVLEARAAGAGSLSHARQREAIARAVMALDAAAGFLGTEPPQPELAADSLQQALRALDFLMGRVDVEAVLDVIFASFCLGK
jgi:tRNA modification GTPase